MLTESTCDKDLTKSQPTESSPSTASAQTYNMIGLTRPTHLRLLCGSRGLDTGGAGGLPRQLQGGRLLIPSAATTVLKGGAGNRGHHLFSTEQPSPPPSSYTSYLCRGWLSIDARQPSGVRERLGDCNRHRRPASGRTYSSATRNPPAPSSRPPLVVGMAGAAETLPNFSLDGGVCVITGGAQGLGLAMGKAVVHSGADLAIVDLNCK